MGDEATKISTAGADALVDFLDGIKTNTQKMIDKGVEVAGALLDSIANGIITMTHKIGMVIVNFLNGMALAIRTHSKEIRQAGINLGSAILDGVTLGLSGKAGGVISGVKNLAGNAVSAFAGAIGAKSPATEFIKLGNFMAQGLVVALNNDKTAAISASNLGNRVITKLQESLSHIPDSLEGLDEFNPTITPILDLTKVQAASSNIDRLMKISKLIPSVSFDKANLIAASTKLDNISNDTPIQTMPTEIKFEQNNYSPKALSINDIYRNTKSQFALAKGELGIS